MESITEQMETVREKYPDAVIESLSHGRFLVRVPNYRLPSGWSVEGSETKVVELMFVLPAGFPAICPEHFWTREICLSPIGGRPHYSHPHNKILAYDGETGTWFAWSLQAWNPNRDTIWTYLAVVHSRFRQNK